MTAHAPRSRPRWPWILIAMVANCVGQDPGAVQEADLSSARDTAIDARAPDRGLGRGPALTVAGKAERVLVGFDLVSIPRSVTLQRAELTLQCERLLGLSTKIAARKLARSFKEGTATWPGAAEHGGATWNEAAPGEAWATPGGDMDPGEASTAEVTSGPSTITIDVRSQVQTALEKGQDRIDFVLLGEDLPWTGVVLLSHERGGGPRLRLAWVGAPPSAAAAPRRLRLPRVSAPLVEPKPAAGPLRVEQPPPYQLSQETLRVPLWVRNPSPFDRVDDPVTSGIPFPEGALNDPGELALIDEKGRPVPLQVRVLSRHWRRGGSVKWVLLDFQASVPARGRATYTLVRGAAAKPARSIGVSKERGSLVVDTGVLRVGLDASAFRLLDRVEFDVDGNGTYSPDETIVEANSADGIGAFSDAQELRRFSGTYLMHGSTYEETDVDVRVDRRYYSASKRPLRSLEVEEEGPLKVVVLAKGTHHAEDESPGAIADGLYDFNVRLTFHAGRALVGVEYAIDNSRLERYQVQPNALYLLRDLGLATTFRLKENARATFGLERPRKRMVAANQVLFEAHGGEKTLSRPLGGRIEAHQNSSGGSHWDRMRQWLVRKDDPPRPMQYRGFRVRAAGEQAPLAEGDLLDGWVDVSDDRWGCTVGVDDLAFLFPKSLVVDGTTVRAVLLPPDYGHAWHVDFGERMTSRLVYAFHGGNGEAARLREAYEARNSPMFAWAGAAWYRDSGAVFGGLGVPSSSLQFPSWFDADGDWFDLGQWEQLQAGIRAYGNRSDYNSGGTHATLFSTWNAFLQTGIPVFQRMGEAVTRAHLDTPAWLIDDGRPDYAFIQGPYFNGRMMRETTWFAHRTRLPKTQFESTFFEEGPTTFYAYKGVPDHEHRCVWPAYEAWPLLGSQQALESVRALGARVAGWHYWSLFAITNPKKPMEPIELNLKEPPLPHDDIEAFSKNPLMMERWGYYSRVYGWNALSTAMAFDATGDPFYLEINDWMIRKLALRARETDGAIDDGNLIKPWMLAIALQGLHHLWLVEPDELLGDLITGIGDYVRLDCRYLARKGLPYEFSESSQDVQHYEYHSVCNAGLAAAYFHTRHPRFLELAGEFFDRMGSASYKLSIRMNRTLFPRTQLYQQLAHEPRDDTTSPLAVQDLAVEKIGGTLSLTWTAPADPGGRVVSYQVKLADRPLVEHAGPKGRATQRSFWAGENVAGEPTPAPSGSPEKMVIGAVRPFEGFGARAERSLEQLQRGSWWVAIKSKDAAGNVSSLSNVVKVELED